MLLILSLYWEIFTHPSLFWGSKNIWETRPLTIGLMSLFPYDEANFGLSMRSGCESPLGFVPGMITQKATQVLRGQNMEHENGGLVQIMIFLFQLGDFRFHVQYVHVPGCNA